MFIYCTSSFTNTFEDRNDHYRYNHRKKKELEEDYTYEPRNIPNLADRICPRARKTDVFWYHISRAGIKNTIVLTGNAASLHDCSGEITPHLPSYARRFGRPRYPQSNPASSAYSLHHPDWRA